MNIHMRRWYLEETEYRTEIYIVSMSAIGHTFFLTPEAVKINFFLDL